VKNTYNSSIPKRVCVHKTNLTHHFLLKCLYYASCVSSHMWLRYPLCLCFYNFVIHIRNYSDGSDGGVLLFFYFSFYSHHKIDLLVFNANFSYIVSLISLDIVSRFYFFIDWHSKNEIISYKIDVIWGNFGEIEWLIVLINNGFTKFLIVHESKNCHQHLYLCIQMTYIVSNFHTF
jgi:hypothetical protein